MCGSQRNRGSLTQAHRVLTDALGFEHVGAALPVYYCSSINACRAARKASRKGSSL